MRVKFLGHAGLYVETAQASILCDPWLSGPAYHGSWWPFPDNDGIDREAIGRPTYLFISHVHLDHFDASFLKHEVSKEAAVLLPDFPLGSLERELRGLGFERFIPTQSWVPFELDGLRLTIPAMVSPADGPIGDSGLLIEEDGVRLFNQNDSRPLGGLEQLGQVDLHFLQFSGAIGYPFLQGYPEKMRIALGRRKRLVSMERARRYVDAVHADRVFPSSGPPCFLDPGLFWLNDLGNDEGNVFPDPLHFFRYMAEQGGIRPELIVPGSVVEITRKGTRVTHPMSCERIADLYSADGKRRYLDDYRERKRPLMERIDASLLRGEVNLVEELRDWWEPLLARADVVCAGVNGRMVIDFVEDAADDALVVDFHERTVRQWCRDEADDVAHRFTFPRDLVVDSVLGRREDWNTDLLLSFRFQERSRGPFNKYLFAFLSALSQERIDYVENFYRREAHSPQGGARSFFQVDLAGRRHIVQRRCPHGAGNLEQFLEYDEQTDVLTCNLHGWQWRLDGTCLTADGHPLYVRPADVALQCSECTYRVRPPAWAEADRPATGLADTATPMSGD